MALPYLYRTRPADRRWSAREAAWTLHEQGANILTVTAAAQPNRHERRATLQNMARRARMLRRRALVKYIAAHGRGSIESTSRPRTPRYRDLLAAA